MRFLSGVVGAVIGSFVGLVITLFLVTMMSHGNVLAEGFSMIHAAPVGVFIGAVLGVILALRILLYLRGAERTRSNRISLTLSLILGIPAVIMLMLWGVRNFHKPPSDAQLLANFERHEATFNQLVEMAKTDKWLTRVGEDWTFPKNPETIGVPSARLSTYRRLFMEARVPRGFEATGFGYEIDFFYWGIGSAISSDIDKGYAYLAQPPADLLDNLDHCQPQPRGDNRWIVYRHVRGNWYLFYAYIPG